MMLKRNNGGLLGYVRFNKFWEGFFAKIAAYNKLIL